MDRASAAETEDLISITGRVKPQTIKLDIYSFPAWRSVIKGTAWSFHRLCRQVDRWQLDSKAERSLHCLLAKAACWIECNYNQKLDFFRWILTPRFEKQRKKIFQSRITELSTPHNSKFLTWWKMIHSDVLWRVKAKKKKFEMLYSAFLWLRFDIAIYAVQEEDDYFSQLYYSSSLLELYNFISFKSKQKSGTKWKTKTQPKNVF